MRKEDLHIIEASTFYEGMFIDREIYFKYNNSYILLCSNVTLTSQLITRLHQAEQANETLYVDKGYVAEIKMQSEQFKLQHNIQEEKPIASSDSAKSSETAAHIMDLTAKLNLQKDYSDLRGKAVLLLETIEKENRVPEELGDTLAQDISDKIELIDPSLLLQCINNLRKPDDYLYAHSTNVGILNGMIGTWLKLPQPDVDALVKTGVMHDLGKLKIPEEILNKPSSLTKEEFETVKKHAQYSYDLLKSSGETDERILEGVLSHHERLNGTGYPSGLQADQLLLFSRITAVSDVYDAMVAKHPYRDRHSPFDILAEFALYKFSNLDISIINVFLNNMPQALVGKRVNLSDGRVAEVVYVNPQDFAFPIVEIDGQTISTSPELKCVSMDNFLSVVD